MKPSDLRAFLERHAMSPHRFAKLIGVTDMAVQHWLANRRAMSLSMARLCRLFDRHPELMGDYEGVTGTASV